MAKKSTPKTVTALKHEEATRKNIPTAEFQSVLQKNEQNPVRVAYERRNRDLDPQLVWRGKDEQDWSDLVVHAPPLYIQEKVHPKALIDDLLRETREREHEAGQSTPDLFADFNGMPKGVDKTEFYQHDQNWSNRMILGDSLQVMASLAEREGLRGKVQCIYLDPPYGIKFNSNFQWSTTSRDVKDGNVGQITREPEQVKAFRDTWRDGIHSYLTYLRDRLTVARDLLNDSGSIFVQIGDENVHRVRAVLDDVFGEENFVSEIVFQKTSSTSSDELSGVFDILLWFRKTSAFKYRSLFQMKQPGEEGATQYTFGEGVTGARRTLAEWEASGTDISNLAVFSHDNITSQRPAQGDDVRDFTYEGKLFEVKKGTFKTDGVGLRRLSSAKRMIFIGNTLRYVRFLSDFKIFPYSNLWTDTTTSGFAEPKVYVVQTNAKVIERCMLMATDPGDLVCDPTCGSGTTAYVAEQWGRRWITIDTSRVALALARARIMGARYPYYLLADSREGQLREAEVGRAAPSSQPVRGNIRHGFVYERVPHIALGSIANNAEIDVIWDKWQAELEPLRQGLNVALKKTWQEWEIPGEPETKWPDAAKKLHTDWWQARIARQKEIDASIAAKAEFEYLYDRPYDDKKKVRVAGPFTVESLSPHRVLGVDENDELIDTAAQPDAGYAAKQTFPQMILENLKTSGVQQAHKEDRITFTALKPWPGKLICAEGRYIEGNAEKGAEKRAAIFIGPEFGTVTRPDLVEAAREAGDADFDVLIACAFNYEAHATEFSKLGRIPVLKARMNADLHMADDLKNTGKGNLFVIFGEPDITILPEKDGKLRVKVNGVDVFHPQTGEVRSDGPDGIACWFIDTDYNEESFFVRHAYFLGANDPYSALKTTLKADDDEQLYFGLITSRSAVTTLESRIKIRRGVRIQPKAIAGLLRLFSWKSHANNLRARLRGREPMVLLSPKLSSNLVERLASIQSNHGAMRAVAEFLSAPKNFSGPVALQEDALRTALKAFRLSSDDQAVSIQLVKGRESGLARFGIMEDSVIEHDARDIPGYDLVASHLTGHAVFERDNERLEVFTANRRPLERVFGVDLIYLNASRQNIVMLQYKMLEPWRRGEVDADWIYRPDSKLDEEIRRMRRFATEHRPGPHEYRLNPAVFYLKFVKRNSLISSGGIITPLDHFETLRRDPACRGPRKGLRLSYGSLSGRYLRPMAFLDLLRSGYIGAHAETTEHLKVLIQNVLNGNRALVAAIQQPKQAGHGNDAEFGDNLEADLADQTDV
jgi:adenine-specific DNA-methyltransferase